ncbi:hypothetical protein PAQ31011_03583 [Pandoraea aquatica]|uniref:Uncharacterized protein n=1 Tax=Pandoraea aquatica TaxID=2508290 RepID=A0A5E4WZ28_9BURK|nr:hypothetical protein [Pandoraea aquatica]VVE29304.1 hypothetical protein PAQ31011_03583 [Pandoraea aquatica]
MIEANPQPTVPVVVTSPPEVTTQAKGQESLSADFTGAARREGPSDDAHVELGNPPIEPDYGHGRLPDGGPSNFPGLDFVGTQALGRVIAPTDEGPDDHWEDGTPRDVESLTRRGRSPAPPPWGRLSNSSQVQRATSTRASPVVGDDRLWDGEFSGRENRHWYSAGSPSPQVHTVFEVRANVPAKVQITTDQSFTSRQLMNRQDPAGYSRYAATDVGEVRGKRLPTQACTTVAGAATAGPADDPFITYVREKLLPDWSSAAKEDGDTACDAFYASTVQRSLDSAEKQIYETYQNGFVSMLGELPHEYRLKALTRLLAQEKGDAKAAVKKHLATVKEVIPDNDKEALAEILSGHGIKG